MYAAIGVAITGIVLLAFESTRTFGVGLLAGAAITVLIAVILDQRSTGHGTTSGGGDAQDAAEDSP